MGFFLKFNAKLFGIGTEAQNKVPKVIKEHKL